jgi:threonine/homoserine/homoserine lactone efflux protein
VPGPDTTLTTRNKLLGGHVGLVFCALTLGWLASRALTVVRAGDFLRRPRIRRTLEGLTGAALVALGSRLATERS